MNESVLRERISRVSVGCSETIAYQVLLGGSAPTHVVEASLSASEAARANTFRFTRLRARFVWCRAALRHILGSLLKRAPTEVVLRETDTGRPFVPNADLDFNVTHSGDLALIAVMPGKGKVGVDLERIVEISDLFGLARTVCTSRELGQLLRQGEDRLEWFYRLWTCKEAYLKGVGSGLTGEAARVEIGVAERGHTLRQVAPDGRCFEITNFSPRPRFVAALAVSPA